MSCLCNLRVPFVPLSRAIAKRWQTWRDNSATNVRGKKFESDSEICRTRTNTSFSLLSFPNAYVDFPSAAGAIGETQGSVADNFAAVQTLLTTKLTPLLHQGLDFSNCTRPHLSNSTANDGDLTPRHLLHIRSLE